MKKWVLHFFCYSIYHKNYHVFDFKAKIYISLVDFFRIDEYPGANKAENPTKPWTVPEEKIF